MFSNTEVNDPSVRRCIPSACPCGQEGESIDDGGVVGLSQVCRASPELGHDASDGIDDVARRGPRRDGRARFELWQGLGQPIGEFAGKQAIEETCLLGVALPPRSECDVPFGV